MAFQHFLYPFRFQGEAGDRRLNRHADHHAVIVIIYNRGEHGFLFQTGDLLHFRQVLVIICQTVKTGAVQFRSTVGSFDLGDHFLAAAVAGHGEALHRIVLGQQSAVYHGIHQRSEPAGITARHCHTLGVADLFPMLRRQFRKTVCPVRIGAVCRGSINDPHVRIARQCHSFSRGIVRQAQECHVAFQNGSPSCLRILSGFLSQGNHGQIVPVCQTLMDTQTSRACLSVNKYLYSHFSTSFPCRTIRAGRFSADDHCFRRFYYVRLRCRHCLSLHIVHNVDIILFGTFLR